MKTQAPHHNCLAEYTLSQVSSHSFQAQLPVKPFQHCSDTDYSASTQSLHFDPSLQQVNREKISPQIHVILMFCLMILKFILVRKKRIPSSKRPAGFCCRFYEWHLIVKSSFLQDQNRRPQSLSSHLKSISAPWCRWIKKATIADIACNSTSS